MFLQAERRKKEIEEQFDANYNRKDNARDMSGLVLGATVIMEKGSQTHIVVRDILKEALEDSTIRLPTLVPSTKLINLLHTKRKYLTKLRE